MADRPTGGDAAVLVSGGLDSAILAVALLRDFERVHPLYVRCGLRWEAVELNGLRAFLEATPRPGLRPLRVLDEPVAAIYGPHWSTGSARVPDARTDDDAVYLPGRNLLLVTKAAVWCRLHGVEALALGGLKSNPFPDSTPEFYQAFEAVLARGLGGRVRIIRPFETLSKADVVRLGVAAAMPLERTVSCLDPREGRHCGVCNKCAERRRGFRDAGLDDPTSYASDPLRSLIA